MTVYWFLIYPIRKKWRVISVVVQSSLLDANNSSRCTYMAHSTIQFMEDVIPDGLNIAA